MFLKPVKSIWTTWLTRMPDSFSSVATSSGEPPSEKAALSLAWCCGWWPPLVSVHRGMVTQESRGNEMIDALAGPGRDVHQHHRVGALRRRCSQRCPLAAW